MVRRTTVTANWEERFAELVLYGGQFFISGGKRPSYTNDFRINRVPENGRARYIVGTRKFNRPRRPGRWTLTISLDFLAQVLAGWIGVAVVWHVWQLKLTKSHSRL